MGLPEVQAMDVITALAGASDAEAEAYLNTVLKGWMATQPAYANLVTSPESLSEAVASAAAQVGKPVAGAEIAAEERPKGIRAVLVEMAGDESFRPRLEAAIEGYRPKLIEPVTTSLVLAGIVMLLS